jgi:hypothetical protein
MSGWPDLSDIKGPRQIKFYWRLKRLDIVHARVRRTAPQCALQLRQRGIWPLRNYFNRPIGQIAGEPAELEAFGLMHDKPPEPHALNATTDNPAAARQTDETLRRRRRSTYTSAPMNVRGINANIAHVT